MIPAVSLAQVQSNRVAFKGDEKSKATEPDFNDEAGKAKSFDEMTSDEQADVCTQAGDKLREQSDKFLNSDKAHERAIGHVLKFGANLLLVAASFFVCKGSGKGGFQSIKGLMKSEAVKPIIENVSKEVKKPVEALGEMLKTRAIKFMNGPKGDKAIKRFANSKLGKKVTEYLNKRSAAKAVAEGASDTANKEKTFEQRVEEVIGDVSGATGATATAATVFTPAKDEDKDKEQ